MLAKLFWEWCIERSIFLSAKHLPGVLNTVADTKSRKFNDQLEWKLDETVFRTLGEIYGKPEVDLYAQVATYVSWHLDPGAVATNAFSIPWGDKFLYAFPPFCLIGRCLQNN